MIRADHSTYSQMEASVYDLPIPEYLFHSKSWIFIDLEFKYRIYGLDLRGSAYGLNIDISDTSPAINFLTIQKNICQTNVTFPLAHSFTVFCHGQYPVGQFVIFSTFGNIEKTVRIVTTNIFGQFIENPSKIYFTFIIFLNKISCLLKR